MQANGASRYQITMIPVDEIKFFVRRSRAAGAYARLKDSIREMGLKIPISVRDISSWPRADRRRQDGGGGHYKYELICGQGRLQAFRELGLDKIPAVIHDVAEVEIVGRFLAENVMRKKLGWVEKAQLIKYDVDCDITPEEIARQAVLEIKGSNTGHDVIAAIDGAVMNPTYRAGYLRHRALQDVARLEQTTNTHSVALGQLGPPELGKLLWEAYLLKLQYVTLSAVTEESEDCLASELFALVQSDTTLRQTITSVGLPILTPDGCALIRGPFIRIPESPNVSTVPLTREGVEKWADKGWVDLRPKNMQRWRQRFQRMRRDSQRLRGRGSAAFIREAYLSDDILIGEVVAWILINEELGYRIK